MRSWILAVTIAFNAFASSAEAQIPKYITSWGSFGTGDGQFSTPVGVGVDGDGFVYVVDTNLPRVQRFTRTGSYVSQWSSPGARDVEVGPDGLVYVVGNGQVSKYSRSGALIGSWVTRTATTSIAVDVEGSVYVSSWLGYVTKFTNYGQQLLEWTVCCGRLDGVAVDGHGSVYTVEQNGTIRNFTTDGESVRQWGSHDSGSGDFDLAVRLCTSPDGSKVYVVDHLSCRVQVFDPSGVSLGQWGFAGSGPGQFAGPIGIAADKGGNLYVADTNNGRIQLFGSAATATRPISWGDLKRFYR